jgi:hypothetical protein
VRVIAQQFSSLEKEALGTQHSAISEDKTNCDCATRYYSSNRNGPALKRESKPGAGSPG